VKVNVYLNDLKDYAAMNGSHDGKWAPSLRFAPPYAAAGGSPETRWSKSTSSHTCNAEWGRLLAASSA